MILGSAFTPLQLKTNEALHDGRENLLNKRVHMHVDLHSVFLIFFVSLSFFSYLFVLSTLVFSSSNLAIDIFLLLLYFISHCLAVFYDASHAKLFLLTLKTVLITKKPNYWLLQFC